MFSGVLGLYLPGVYTGQEVYCPIVNILVYLLKGVMRKSLMIRSPSSLPQRSQKPKQYSRMIQSIHDIYARSNTFLDDLANDLEDGAVWFNNSEFARYHDINGQKILSVMTAGIQPRKIDINLGDNEKTEGVSKGSVILYCRAQETTGVNANQPVRVDGKMYTVSEARLIQDQVWRIVLEANNG